MPRHDDICYATTNRQEAVKILAQQSDVILVIGSKNSSNSVRLVEVAEKSGCKAFLIDDYTDIMWDKLTDIKTLGITAGASAPEILVSEVITAMRKKFTITTQELSLTHEDVHFKLPVFPVL